MEKKLYNRRRKYVGILLQRERKCLHFDQEDIAKKLGIRQELISKIEVGTRRIDIIELIDYCEVLNLTLADFAWKIETFLFSEGLLPRPKTHLTETRETKKIRIDVSWRENKFSASFGEIVPETVVFIGDTFVDLQIEIDKGLDSYIKGMGKDGDEMPLWFKDKKYEFEYKFHDARSLLNAYNTYISLAAISRVSDINQNLLSQYANGIKNARPYQMERIIDAIHKIGKELMATVI